MDLPGQSGADLSTLICDGGVVDLEGLIMPNIGVLRDDGKQAKTWLGQELRSMNAGHVLCTPGSSNPVASSVSTAVLNAIDIAARH